MAAYQMGEASFPSLAFFNLSFLLFFLRREQGRLDEMEQATRDYAASHADVPAIRVGLTFLLAELGRIDEARGALAAFDEAALERLHDRNWPASWFQLARAASIVGDRAPRRHAARTPEPSVRALRPGLARHGLPRSHRPCDGLAASHRRRSRCRCRPLPVGGRAQRPHRSAKLARPGSSRSRAPRCSNGTAPLATIAAAESTDRSRPPRSCRRRVVGTGRRGSSTSPGARRGSPTAAAFATSPTCWPDRARRFR